MKYRRAVSLAPALAVLAASWFSLAQPASAWGGDGHRIINMLAARAFPSALPDFVRTPSAIDEIAYLGPEEDRLKGSGESWGEDNDPAHYIDLNDDGTIAGVIAPDALPASLGDYAKALAAAHTDPYRVGYLPYAMLDGWEQLRKDFALWRVDDYLARHATTQQARTQYDDERSLRQTLTLRDIGVWGHFVGDGCQPLHTTVHFNGWGKFPNPNDYSMARNMHAKFESDFVRRHADVSDVLHDMTAFAPADPAKELAQDAVMARIVTYLRGSDAEVAPLYGIEKQHGFDDASPQAIAFVDKQLARGASELRDLVALAWEDSLNVGVGYPELPVRTVITGAATPAGDE